MTVSKKNLTKVKVPALPFSAIKDYVLGPSYTLSLVFVGNKLSHQLNRDHLGKDRPTNVLAFPLDHDLGEIFINLDWPDHEVGFLFIHGLLHLKGRRHGSKMESEEREISKRFFLHDPSPRHRARHRHGLTSRRRRRISPGQ